MKNRLIRIIGVVAVLEIGYLVLINLALTLPLTQTLLNQLKPDKFSVSWDRAWSWYPFRVHAEGVFVNGQTSSQQWQAEATRASASVSLLPLLTRTVKISGVDAENAEFRLRPRPKPDKDYALIREFFPPIEGRDPDLPAVPKVRKPGTGWTIAADDIHARGQHAVWVYQVRATLQGDLRADLSYTGRGGPFSLSRGRAEVEIASLVINDEVAVSQAGRVAGSFQMAPFVPAENKGVKALGFLAADAEVDMPVESLDFLDIYLGRFNGMEVDGVGTLKGRLHYDRGNLSQGTDLLVTASELALNVDRYRVQGTGSIHVKATPLQDEVMDVQILFGALDAFHGGQRQVLFRGDNLLVELRGSNRILNDEKRVAGGGRALIRIPEAAVPDLDAYQYLLPDRWPVRLHGGTGKLKGEAELSASALSADLHLFSEDADLALKDYRFVANLELGLKARGGTDDTALIDLSGTYLTLDDARLASAEAGQSKPWQASLTLSEGALRVPVAGAEAENPGFRYAMKTLSEQNLQEILTEMDAKIDAELQISDLSWLNLLLQNPFDLAVFGSGKVEADLDIQSGWFAAGSALSVRPQDLQVQFLDYLAAGDGRIDLAVARGGEAPDLVLEASLAGGNLRRRDEEESVVEAVELVVAAEAQQVRIGEDARVSAIDLRIPTARVSDLSVYNGFFPEQMPVRLSGGEANLSADIHLERETAGGYLRFETKGLRSQLGEQQLAGELSLDITLTDGVPANMDFDISGSSLRLDGFKVVGEHAQHDRPGWQGSVDLHKGRVVWKKPIQLDLEAGIAMNDSRPIVAILANERGKHGWIEKLLTVHDVEGEASLSAKSRQLVIAYAFAGSDKIDVGAKGLINDDTREGIFLARYRKLQGILKSKDGDRNFDLIRAREKFDSYMPGETSVGLGNGESAQMPVPPGSNPD